MIRREKSFVDVAPFTGAAVQFFKSHLGVPSIVYAMFRTFGNSARSMSKMRLSFVIEADLYNPPNISATSKLYDERRTTIWREKSFIDVIPFSLRSCAL